MCTPLGKKIIKIKIKIKKCELHFFFQRSDYLIIFKLFYILLNPDQEIVLGARRQEMKLCYSVVMRINVLYYY